MALFPSTGPQYYDEKDKYIKQYMEHFYNEHVTNNLAYTGEADVDTRMYCGDQSMYNDMYGVASPGRKKNFVFNRIRRTVDMVSGYQRQHRKSLNVIPRENADQETADQLSKVLTWAFDRDSTYATISTSFQNAMITGLNLLQVWVDYRTDPISGNLRVDNCNYNSFLIDTNFKKQDLSDCNGIWKRSFVTRAEALTLLPAAENEIMSLPGQKMQDGKFPFLPEYYSQDRSNLLTYDEFYYRTYRRQTLLVDRQSGETMEWKSQDENALREFLAFFPQVTTINTEIPTVNLAIVVQGKTLYDGANPSGTDKYPFVPVMGYFHPEMPYYSYRIQGMVRGLRDTQYLYNRRKIIEFDILESQPNSGWIYKENALINPSDIFLTGQGRGIALKEEAAMTDVQQIQPPRIDPSMMELTMSLGKEIPELSGVNEELLGSAQDDKAGVLAMLRQGAGLTTLQTLFDQLDTSMKLLGTLAVDIIQTNFTPGKVSKIIEGEASPNFNNKAFGVYDAVVEEGFDTATQRQMMFAQLVSLRELGVPVTDEDLLDAATIQNKTKIIENMQKRAEQASQMQQMELQATMQEQAARTNLANARATADEGLGIERLSRVKENQALADERRAEAVKDRMTGTLDMVRAMKELEDIDIRQVQQLIALSQVLKAQEEINNAEDDITQSAPEQPGLDRGANLAAQAQVGQGGLAQDQGLGPAVSTEEP